MVQLVHFANAVAHEAPGVNVVVKGPNTVRGRSVAKVRAIVKSRESANECGVGTTFCRNDQTDKTLESI